MGYCKLECPDGEAKCCIYCTKQDSCQCRCDDMTVMNTQSSVRNMRLIDLVVAIGMDSESCEKIQICHPGRNWEDYDEFSAGSKLLKPFYNLKVKCLSAISTDVIRVDLDFDDKGGGVE